MPNGFGLYDMHGNVYDYCLDWFKEDISDLNGEVVYEGGKIDNTSGRCVVRKGGHWGQGATSMLRAADRQDEPSTVRKSWDGFRVKCTAGLK